MTDATCAVADCDRPVRARGFCHAHYARFLRTGKVPETAVRRYEHAATCELDDCDRPRHGLGFCHLHYKRQVQFGDVTREKQMPAGEDHWNWSGAAITYQGLHKRIYRAHGPASKQACAHCPGQAEQWAYDQQDPDERIEGKLRYSVDPAHYIPLCVPCHVSFDRSKAA